MDNKQLLQSAKDQAAREWNSEFDFMALRNGVQIGNIKMIHLDFVIDRAMEIYAEMVAVEFADWIRDNTVADGAPKLLHRESGKRMTTQELFNQFKTTKP